MAEKDWRNVVLKTIKETPSKKTGEEGKGYGIWLIMRVTPDDKCFGVKVVSGQYYTMNGEKKYPKDGLNKYDFDALRPIFLEQIAPLIDPRNPPPVPQIGAEEPAPPADEIEQPPF